MFKNPRCILLCMISYLFPMTDYADENPIIHLNSTVWVQNENEPFDYFSNSWSCIGLKNYAHGTRISPKGELLLGEKVVCRPLIGKKPVPFNNQIKKVLHKGYLPIVKYNFIAGKFIRYEIEMFAVPEQWSSKTEYEWSGTENFWNVIRVQLSNVRGMSCATYFGLEWEKENLKLESVPKLFPAEETRAILSNQGTVCIVNLQKGHQISLKENQVQVRVGLSPHGSSEIVFMVPYVSYKNLSDEKVQVIGNVDYEKMFSQTVAFWEDELAEGMQLNIAEGKVLNTYKASLVYQKIGLDHDELHAGEGFYDELYLRDAAYQAISLVHAGYPEEAKKALELFLTHQQEDGQFITQKGQLDAHGYSLWALVEYSRLTGDVEWLRRIYPNLKKGVEWLQEKRRTETDESSPFYGILPNAIADGEYLWGGEYHIVGYDWWNVRGLQFAVEAARILKKEKDAEEWESEFRDYKQSILSALKKTNLEYIPPSYEKVGTHWGNLEVIFPSPLIDPHDALVTETLKQVHDEFGGGFCEGIIRWSPGRKEPAIHPYMSQFVTNTHIARGECKEAIDGFYSFLLHTSSTHAFPEGVHYEKREAWNNTIPHLWAAALYVTTLRNMLVREFHDELHLLSCVPYHWLESGKSLSVREAMTYFGTVEYSCEAGEESIKIKIIPPKRKIPEKIVVHLPDGIHVHGFTHSEEGMQFESENGIVIPSERIRQPLNLGIKIRRDDEINAMSYEKKVKSFLDEN